MASAAARSICLFREESIGAASVAVTIWADRSSHKMKWLCYRGKAQATMWTGIKTARRSETKCSVESQCRSKSSCSGLPSRRKEEESSLHGSHSRVPKVVGDLNSSPVPFMENRHVLDIFLSLSRKLRVHTRYFI